MKKLLLCLLSVAALLLPGCGGPAETTESPAAAVIEVYVGDDSAERFVTLSLPAETVDACSVFEALKTAGTVPGETELISLERDGGALTLDMSGEFGRYVSGMGTAGEYMLIGSVVNTYLKALDAETLTILSEGAPLETGHNVYDTPLGFFEDNTGE